MSRHEDESLRQAIAARLQARRTACGLSIRQLARAADIEKSNIQLLLKGASTPSAATLVRLATVLDCSVDYLCGREKKCAIPLDTVPE